MAFIITIADLGTHIYQEYLDEITRDDDDLIQSAIDRAVDQAAGYCSRYDITALFGSASVNASVESPQLKGIVKDLALWHLIQLSNPNIEMNRAQAAYEYAVSWLKDLQKGLIMPNGWPYHDTTTDGTPPEGDAVAFSSNVKRRNHF